MNKHHYGRYKPNNAKPFLVKDAGQKYSEKESNKFCDDSSGSEKDSTSDDGTFQIFRIEIGADAFGGGTVLKCGHSSSLPFVSSIHFMDFLSKYDIVDTRIGECYDE